MISCAMETVLVSSIETALSLFIRDQVWGDERCTLSILKYLSPLIVFYDFDHSSYSKSYESIIYFVCYILYYSCYFNLNLLFYTFRIFFKIRWMIKVVWKSQWRQISWYGRSIFMTTLIDGWPTLSNGHKRKRMSTLKEKKSS
jgi:hypothetical protein